MTRHWKSFDSRVTDKEFLSLPIDDRVSLFEAMKLYRLDAGIGYVVKSYGDDLKMIKPKDGQGRCIFFTEVHQGDHVELVALLAYKKESQKLPDSVRRLALQRKQTYLGSKE